MNDSPQSSPSRYNPPQGKILGGNGGQDPPQSGISRCHQQISPVTVLAEKDNQTSHKNSYHHQQQAHPATVLPENDILDNQSSHKNSHHHKQTSPVTVVPRNNQSSHHHHHQESPVTVVPKNENPENQSSKKNSHNQQQQEQQHQSSPSGQVPPPPSGFHQERSDPPVNSHGGSRDKKTEPKACDPKTNIVHANVIVIQQNPNPPPSEAEGRLPKPPGYPNNSGPPIPKPPPNKGKCQRCLEKTFPCFF